MFKRLCCAMLLVVCLLGNSNSAKAGSFGDSALTVLIGAGVGAILGASTLPFYEKSGEHTSNIYVGAAIGAVLGVAFTALNALGNENNYDFEEEYEEAEKNDFTIRSLRVPGYLRNTSVAKAIDIPRVLTPRRAKGGAQFLVWTPIQSFYF